MALLLFTYSVAVQADTDISPIEIQCLKLLNIVVDRQWKPKEICSFNVKSKTLEKLPTG